MNKNLQRKLASATGTTIDTMLVAIAIVLVLVAICVKNKYIKAAVLAYEILP